MGFTKNGELWLKPGEEAGAHKEKKNLFKLWYRGDGYDNIPSDFGNDTVLLLLFSRSVMSDSFATL